MFWLIHALRSMVDGGAAGSCTNARDGDAAIGRSLGIAVCAAVLIAANPGFAQEAAPSAPEPAATSAAADEDNSVRSITIEMESLSFKPTSISVTAGETVRFVLKNIGDIPHEFTIGTPLVQSGRRAVMRELFDADILQEYLADAPEREGPNSVVILGGETRDLLWTFTETQDIEFGCNLPLHYEAGMRGDINVTIPPKSDAVASHNHDHGGEPKESKTNGLANLAQLMAKAREAVDGNDAAEKEAAVSEPEAPAADPAPASEASSDQTDPPESGETPDASTAADAGQPETSAADKVAAAEGENDKPEGVESEEEQINGNREEEEKGTETAASTESAAVTVAARAPEYKAFDRGLALMSKGDVLGARLEFERSATAEAALALGRSYDESYLSRIENPNARPDANAARQWYEAWYRISVRQGAISAETNLDLLIEAMTR